MIRPEDIAEIGAVSSAHVARVPGARRSCSCARATARRWGLEGRSLRGLGADGLGLAEDLGGALLGELLLGGGEEVLVFVEALGGAHPRPVAGEPELAAAVALAGVGALGGRDDGVAVVAQRNCSRSARICAAASAREPRGEVGVDVEGPLEEGAQGAHLAAGGAAGALGGRCRCPRRGRSWRRRCGRRFGARRASGRCRPTGSRRRRRR